MTNYVLVHGAFVGGSYWGEVARLLEADGHRVDVIEQLPSAGPDPGTLGDFQADVQEVTRAVEAVDAPVVLVAHSAGGAAATELADHPAVARTVYLAAMWPARGQSVLDLLSAGPPMDWATPQDDGTFRTVDDLDLLHQRLCADVDRERAEVELRRMVFQSGAGFATPSSAPDRAHPTTYIICEQDNAVPTAAQEQMSAAADEVHRLPSSHQPMISMPGRLAELLGRQG